MNTKKSEFQSPSEFEFAPEDIQAINQYLQEHPNQLIQIAGIRAALTKSRIERLKAEDIRTFDDYDAGVVENTLEHNLKYLHEAAALNRPDYLINILQSLNMFLLNNQEMKVLTVGPRESKRSGRSTAA